MHSLDIEDAGNMTSFKNDNPLASKWLTMTNFNQVHLYEQLLKYKENVRPWTVFINTSNFRSPANLPRTTKRVLKNIEYFQSNYLFVCLALMAYCLITTPLLLIVMAFNMGLCYYMTLKNQEKKIKIWNVEMSPSQQYTLITLIALPFYYWAGVGSAIFWVLGASLVVIFIHASLFNYEAVVNPEESFDLNIEQV